MQEAAALNFMDVRKLKLKLEAYNNDSTAVVFEVGKVFSDPSMNPIGGYFMGMLPINGKLKGDLSSPERLNLLMIIFLSSLRKCTVVPRVFSFSL